MTGASSNAKVFQNTFGTRSGPADFFYVDSAEGLVCHMVSHQQMLGDMVAGGV